MPSDLSLLVILQHTPTWVWVLLLALVTLGLLQTVPRRVALRRALILPVAMLAWSLWGAASTFASPVALLAWSAGVVAAATVCLRLGAPPDARWSAAARRFELPGSWVPLVLILTLFCLKFALGVALALRPEWRAGTLLAGGAGLAFGAFSGIFAGRALALLQLARGTRMAAAA